MNDQQRAAMQMALEALEANMQDEIPGQWTKMDNACTALREALAQPQGEWVDLTDDELMEVMCELAASNVVNDSVFADAVIAKFKEKNTPPVVPQGEPVAWMRENEDCTDCFVWERDEEHTIPLYTTPPSVEAAHSFNENCECAFCMNHYTDMAKAVADAIEATKEKAAKVCKDYAEKCAEAENWEAEDVALHLDAAIRGMK